MSEKSPQEPESLEEREEALGAILPLTLAPTPAPMPATDRINMEVLRQIAVGNELETWQTQIKRRLQWMAVPLLVGVGCGVFLLNTVLIPAKTYSDPPPEYLLKMKPLSATYIGKKQTPIGPNTPGGKQR